VMSDDHTTLLYEVRSSKHWRHVAEPQKPSIRTSIGVSLRADRSMSMHIKTHSLGFDNLDICTMVHTTRVLYEVRSSKHWRHVAELDAELRVSRRTYVITCHDLFIFCTTTTDGFSQAICGVSHYIQPNTLFVAITVER
jgi:hypothetical protein